jgi:hypothetical protein
MNDFDIKLELKKLKLDAEILQLRGNALVVGRPVRILSDYNGQPYGRSKRSLKGETRTAERVVIDPHWGVSLFLRGERLAIPANEVEWL